MYDWDLYPNFNEFLAYIWISSKYTGQQQMWNLQMFSTGTDTGIGEYQTPILPTVSTVKWNLMAKSRKGNNNMK